MQISSIHIIGEVLLVVSLATYD